VATLTAGSDFLGQESASVGQYIDETDMDGSPDESVALEILDEDDEVLFISIETTSRQRSGELIQMFGIESTQQTFRLPRPPGRGMPRPVVGVTAITQLQSGTHAVVIRVLDPLDYLTI